MIRIEKLLSVAQLNVSRLSCLCTARCFKESRTHDGQSLYELPPHYKGPLFIGKKDIRYTANAYRRAVKVLAKKVGYDPNDYSSYSLRRGCAAYMGISSISVGR